MVRVYDPTRTDPTVQFIKGIQSYIVEQQNKLSDEVSQNAVQYFLKQPQYDKMIQQYSENKLSFPDIIMRKDCQKKHYFFKSPNNLDYTHFKANYDQTENQINICTNLITNVVELKENLDRELTLAWDHQIQKKTFEKDDEYACSLIRACRIQLQNYKNTSQDLKQNLSKLCGQYLLRNRGPNYEQLPYDVWNRYVDQVIDDNMYCFHNTAPFSF